MFIGARSCGKGVIERALSVAFGAYIVPLNSNSFLFERTSHATDTEKTIGFLIPLERDRMAFTQDTSTDRPEQDEGRSWKLLITIFAPAARRTQDARC